MNNVKVDIFEGPLDLLLHLLKQSKLSINDLKIVTITNQYIKYINDMKNLNLDIASDYLVMAAELIEMKSKSLLPKVLCETEEVEDDPEEELKRRLEEYKRYKKQSGKFKELESKRKNYYTKLPEVIDNYCDKKLENNDEVSVFDLLDALKNLMKRNEEYKPLNVQSTSKEYSVKDRVKYIRDILIKSRRVIFTDLFEEFSKPYVIVTFISILEMSKNREIMIKQDNNFKEIYLERVD
ncbi:MAG: segregation/condensation protein A [Bacilli bacterium]